VADEPEVFRRTDELIKLVDRYEPDQLGLNLSAHLSRDFVRTYLRMNTIRVAHLAAALKELGLAKGRILEVGSAFGSFAYVLQRLGYQVTAIDRYADFAQSMDAYIELMRSAGVEVIEASRTNEEDLTAALGEYDAVISMAVVEHIPH